MPIYVDDGTQPSHDAPALRSPEEAQQWFHEEGISVASWAVERGFNPSVVYQVLRGQRRCL